MRFLLFLFLTGVLASCVSAKEQTEKAPLYTYRGNMKIVVDGKEFDGVGVTSIGVKDISIVSKAQLDLLKINTCHRDFTIEKVDDGWFGGSGKKYTYHYAPNDREKQPICPMYIQAFDHKGITDWGGLVFRTDETLPAVMECNGRAITYAGVSVCQTMAGLDQVLSFDRDVEFEADALCNVKPQSKRRFIVRANLGFCMAEFSDGKIWHRMIMLGYEKNLIRSN